MTPLPTAPAVPIETSPAVTEAEMARVVPDWATRLAMADEASPWIRMPAFIEGRYLPISRDLLYARADRYNRRVWRALTKARSRGGLLDLSAFDPLPGELACEVHDPDEKGHAIQVSKRLFIRQVLGYLPTIAGWQP